MRFLTAILTIATLLIAGPGLAQSTDAGETTEEQTSTADQAFPVASDDQEPVEGQQYIHSAYTDWDIRCIKGSEQQTCSLYQLLRDENDNPVAEFTVVVLPEGGRAVAGVTFVSPLGTLLTAEVVFRVDSGQARRYPYSWCEASGCVSRFGFTPEELETLQKGITGEVTIAAVATPNQPITLPVSLAGFTAGWNELKALTAPSE